MKQLLYLSGENIELALAEALALAKTNKYKLDSRVLTLETDIPNLHKRLAYTHKIYKFLFSCKEKELVKQIESFEWNSIYKTDFCVRIINSTKKISEPQIADLIWLKLKTPRTNLHNATTKLEFIFTPTQAYCSLLLNEIHKSFEERKAHNREVHQPCSLHPKLARAMVNLTGIESGAITDPFCGTGGILIEAGLMGFKAIGCDINRWMLKASELNLKSFNISRFKLFRKDATTIKKAEYIVTDLPYSKNTKKIDPEKLYLDFLKNLKKIKTKTAVIGFPDFVKHKPIIRKAGLKIKEEFTYYLHRSLSKRIVVL